MMDLCLTGDGRGAQPLGLLRSKEWTANKKGSSLYMDIDWALVKAAKNLVENQLDKPILRFPLVADYREPLADFLRSDMKVLDIGANDRSLKSYLDGRLGFSVDYTSMDVDRTHQHDFYSFEEIQGEFDAVTCFEVVEHITPRVALDLFRTLYRLVKPRGRIFVSTPNVYHPIALWSDCTHITPYRMRHLAGWLGTAGFKRFWGYRVCELTWKKRLRYLRYRGLLRLLNLDFAPGILVVGEKD
jgi:2-polyprenyl-3-methyl-5-hydroxy-6-metoxy-1,4-benzoquinol methylase